jgi:hypothetical protein
MHALDFYRASLGRSRDHEQLAREQITFDTEARP